MSLADLVAAIQSTPTEIDYGTTYCYKHGLQPIGKLSSITPFDNYDMYSGNLECGCTKTWVGAR